MSSSFLRIAEQFIKSFVNTGSSCPVSRNSTWLLDTVLKFWLKNLFLILSKLSVFESVLEESKVHELNMNTSGLSGDIGVGRSRPPAAVGDKLC